MKKKYMVLLSPLLVPIFTAAHGLIDKFYGKDSNLYLLKFYEVHIPVVVIKYTNFVHLENKLGKISIKDTSAPCKLEENLTNGFWSV